MTGLNHDNDRPAVLLLSRDACWTESARREAAGLPMVRLLSANDARDAVTLLCRGERFSHLLIHPSAADGLLPDLIGLTAGEAESGISMVLLGEAGALALPMQDAGRATLVRRASPGWLGQALAARNVAMAPFMAELPLDDLLAALGAGRLQTRYQPVVRLLDGEPLGLEALARLEHPGLGTLPPDRFVPQIEAAGFAAQLAEEVVRRAFGEWRDDALQQLNLWLAVNLPLDVLMRPGATDRLEAWREQAGIDPGRVMVELTETYPVASPELLRPVLDRLRGAGYRLAIDDVGPAMSGHEAVIRLPFTTMKLDLEVVHASAHSEAALRFIERAMVAARRSGLMVIAEGIETADDWERMQRLGVDAAQGFLIARPLTAVAAAIWHAAWPRRGAA
jgi:EAL domain-containing protein (putative c-di-GMP-specific phosphodiesterase class I)